MALSIIAPLFSATDEAKPLVSPQPRCESALHIPPATIEDCGDADFSNDDWLKFVRAANPELVSLARPDEDHCRPKLTKNCLANELIYRSNTPVLLWPAGEHKSPSFKSVLFATDFSPESLQLFGRVLRLVKRSQGKVELFHQNENLNHAVISGRGRPLPSTLAASLILAHANEWKALAYGFGVDCEIHFGGGKQRLSNAVLAAAERLAVYTIAMSGNSSQLKATVFGSSLWNVIRKSTVPVFTWHVLRG